jgi:hypothetical protein
VISACKQIFRVGMKRLPKSTGMPEYQLAAYQVDEGRIFEYRSLSYGYYVEDIHKALVRAR